MTGRCEKAGWMCALSGWLDTAPVISPLETFHNEKHTPHTFLKKKVLRILKVFVFVVVSTIKHLILPFAVNKQKRKVRQVLCWLIRVFRLQCCLHKIRQSAG